MKFGFVISLLTNHCSEVVDKQGGPGKKITTRGQ